MRVTVLVEDTSQTGGIRALAEMANGLIKRGHQCAFVLPRGTRPIPFETQAEILKVGPHVPYIPNVRNLINMSLLGWFVPETDIVVASSWRSCFATYRSARKYGAIGVYFVQADERLLLSDSLPGRLKRQVVQRAYGLPLQWLVNSTWLRGRMYAEFHRDGVVVNPGVDTNIFNPEAGRTAHCGNEQGQYTIVSVGRSISIKGLSDLVEALKRVATVVDIQLILISQEQLAIETSYPVRVVKPQSDQEIAAAYRSADLFVYPSWFEGFGLPPLEAMACGVPVVTTDCGGIREFAIHSVNSLVVPVRDPETMAKAILELLQDPALADRIARNGITTSRSFTWDRFSARIEQIFLDALAD